MNRPSVNWKGDQPLFFASGMAAVAAIFGVVLRAGEVVVLPADSYYTTRVLAEGYFTQMGVQVSLAPTVGDAQHRPYRREATLAGIPSNPGLEVCDIAAPGRRCACRRGAGRGGQHDAYRTGSSAWR